ncbi:hypothetical protein LOTGIDRAFT_229551 [Lottia gigantea]|uniref:Cornifelin n=1 Tax=Lottia gigantea TaxID=225164 RepID=V3ZSY5_LOTGI|nr:hypothetical protein LOTGIDRAFT_229551 [Lottia gigantea]ESO84006.1 hypothetical protein LOTGIDRAFT_229551 [Lottia gigantea]
MAQVVITSQPTSGLVAPVDGNREWSSGLFSCCSDCKALLCTCCCLPCLLCSLSGKIHECSLMPFCVPGGLIAMRARLRTLGGIQGSIFKDCLAVTFCEPCAICQMSREMDSMGL